MGNGRRKPGVCHNNIINYISNGTRVWNMRKTVSGTFFIDQYTGSRQFYNRKTGAFLKFRATIRYDFLSWNFNILYIYFFYFFYRCHLLTGKGFPAGIGNNSNNKNDRVSFITVPSYFPFRFRFQRFFVFY